jgi:hypothetical protein
MIERGFAILGEVDIGKSKLSKVVKYDGADGCGVYHQNRD